MLICLESGGWDRRSWIGVHPASLQEWSIFTIPSISLYLSFAVFTDIRLFSHISVKAKAVYTTCFNYCLVLELWWASALLNQNLLQLHGRKKGYFNLLYKNRGTLIYFFIKVFKTQLDLFLHKQSQSRKSSGAKPSLGQRVDVAVLQSPSLLQRQQVECWDQV